MTRVSRRLLPPSGERQSPAGKAAQAVAAVQQQRDELDAAAAAAVNAVVLPVENARISSHRESLSTDSGRYFAQVLAAGFE